jgi:hypothetical protein
MSRIGSPVTSADQVVVSGGVLLNDSSAVTQHPKLLDSLHVQPTGILITAAIESRGMTPEALPRGID